jgi:hypothetical protein
MPTQHSRPMRESRRLSRTCMEERASFACIQINVAFPSKKVGLDSHLHPVLVIGCDRSTITSHGAKNYFISIPFCKLPPVSRGSFSKLGDWSHRARPQPSVPQRPAGQIDGSSEQQMCRMERPRRRWQHYTPRTSTLQNRPR